jgi:hypothetical protein
MSAMMQSEYRCSDMAWQSSWSDIVKCSFVIGQNCSTEKDHLFYKIKRKIEDKSELWLEIYRKREADDSEIAVVMHWAPAVAGSNPRLVYELAIEIERVLLSNNAKCIFGRVAK